MQQSPQRHLSSLSQKLQRVCRGESGEVVFFIQKRYSTSGALKKVQIDKRLLKSDV